MIEKFFLKKASLPSFPSEARPENDPVKKESELENERERELLLMKCASSLAGAGLYPDNARKTLRLLSQLGEDVIQNGDQIPFSLSAASLANEVRRCDCLGPVQLRHCYEQRLLSECHFLVPAKIGNRDILAFRRVITTWNQNQSQFKCSVIGAVLSIKMYHFEKCQRKNENDYTDI